MDQRPFRVAHYVERKLPFVCTAHRGFSGRFPENTLRAFEEAVRVGADLIEFDVRRSADRELVVFHDHDLRRYTGQDVPVSQTTLAELKRIDAGLGERIPTFDEVIGRFAGRIGMNIHVQDGGELVDRVVERCRQAGILDQVFLAVWWPEEIRRIHQRHPGVWVCSLYEQGSPQMVEWNRPLGVRMLQPGRDVMSAEFVRQAHAAGMVCSPFYADTFSDFVFEKHIGADGVLTDFPDLFFDLFARRGG